jgi:hypothetical protein
MNIFDLLLHNPILNGLEGVITAFIVGSITNKISKSTGDILNKNPEYKALAHECFLLVEKKFFQEDGSFKYQKAVDMFKSKIKGNIDDVVIDTFLKAAYAALPKE